MVSYWWLIIVGIAVLALAGLSIYIFVKKPMSKKIQEVKEWLLYAVTEAEKELGSGTGKIKLRYVYNMFISAFPRLSTWIPFETFSKLVDEVLEEFRDLLDSNENLQSYVNGTTN